MIRHSSFIIRHSLLLTLGAAALLLAGCYQRKQTAVLNPDGSGKVRIETDVAVPAQDLPGRPKPTPVSFGRQVAAQFINNTVGVDAWADVEVTALEDGRAHIAATAYFKDLNDLRFFELPLVFSWKQDGDANGATLTVERTRQEIKSATTLPDAELLDLVAKAQAAYKDRQLALQTQLNVFTLDMTFELPGEVTDSHIFSREGNAVSLAIDDKKAMDAMNKFMADDAALKATFKAGKDLAANDDHMLQSMYGQNGPVTAHVKFAAASQPATSASTRPGDATAFDYRSEMRGAQFRQADMLKDAGIELIPKFIVNESQPATKPATQPGRGR